MGARFQLVRERVPNEMFFAGWAPRAAPPVVPEHVFYAGRTRPPLDVPVATRAAATSLRFGIVLFLVGWAGILFQASFLQQVVFGAPVFEELAKVGLPIALVALLRIRSLALRMLLAWASGAAFGLMEHYVTYVTEDTVGFVERVLFHTASPGLSMLFYDAYESLDDVRSRWAATVPATMVHWANNFGAVALGFGTIVGIPDVIGLVWSGLLTAVLLAATLGALLVMDDFRANARAWLEEAMPRLGLAPGRPVSA